MTNTIALLATLLTCSCLAGAELEQADQCAAGVGTLDAEPGDCVVVRDNPLTPDCQYDFAMAEGAMFRPGECVAFVTDGSRIYMRNAEVTYGPLAKGEECTCRYVSRSR